MNIATLLTKATRSHGERVAVRYGEQYLTYAQFNARVGRLAQTLRGLGIAPGDRVALAQRNSPALLECLFGCWRAGCAAVPINFRLHPEEIAFICQDAEAKALIVTHEHAATAVRARDVLPDIHLIGVEQLPDVTDYHDYEALLAAATPQEQDADVAPTDLAWLFFTSGTTGKPKGAMLTHRNLLVMTMNYYADVHSVEPEDVVLHAAPLTHGSGLYALPAIGKGAANVILHTPSFEPANVFGLVERWRVTNIAFLAPTQIKMLLGTRDRDYDLGGLRCITYGGGPMYVEDLQAAVATFGPVLVQIYGQGEAPMTISYLRSKEHLAGGDTAAEQHLSSTGIPRTDVEVRVVNDAEQEVAAGTIGEIVARGDIVMAGYWNRPEATAEALRGGWLHTGDLGMLDDQGYLFILDRKKDMIISGGNNIYPREIEEVLLTHPAVFEVAIVGVPDPLWGESVKALVVLQPGTTTSEDELIEYCRAHLASYKKPRTVEFVEALPKSAYGKVLKRELRQAYWEGRARQV